MKNWSTEHHLFKATDKLLLAVSGGVIQLCCANCVNRPDTILRIAHVNFQLRGGESDTDEQFVRQLAQKI